MEQESCSELRIRGPGGNDGVAVLGTISSIQVRWTFGPAHFSDQRFSISTTGSSTSCDLVSPPVRQGSSYHTTPVWQKLLVLSGSVWRAICIVPGLLLFSSTFGLVTRMIKFAARTEHS